ncbi:MAG: PD-(D/E)XK nuclease-like domain-containing protein [Thiotrichaceae bacterium]
MIHKNMSFSEYRKMDGLNASLLKPYSISPARGLYKETKEFKKTMAMSLGSIVHAHILEGKEAAQELINSHYITSGFPVNESTNKPYGETSGKYQDWLKTQDPSREVIFPDILDTTVNNIVKAVSRHPGAVDMLTLAVHRETAITWICKYTGKKCKAMVDYFGNRTAGDLKTFGREMTKSSIEREIYDRQYHLQFAFYRDGLIENGIAVDEFNVIFAGTSEENDVAACIINADTLEAGRNSYLTAIENYNIAKNCTGSQVGLFPEVIEIGIPNYHLNNDDVDQEEKLIIKQMMGEL